MKKMVIPDYLEEDVRRLKKRKKKKLTPEDVLSSEAMRRLLSRKAKIISKKYGENIDVNFIEEDSAGYTDGNKISINPSPIKNGLLALTNNLFEQLALLKGIVVHECGHILYTDFDTMIDIQNKIFGEHNLSKIVDEETLDEVESDALEKINKLLSENKAATLLYAYKQISNTLEDAYIENRLLDEYPGEPKEDLLFLRDFQKSTTPYLEEQIESKLPSMYIIFNLLLNYAKYGTVKCINTHNLYYEDILDISQIVDDGITENSQLKRLKATFKIILRLWDKYFDEFANKDEPREYTPREEHHHKAKGAKSSGKSKTTHHRSEKKLEKSESKSSDKDKTDGAGADSGKSSDSSDGESSDLSDGKPSDSSDGEGKSEKESGKCLRSVTDEKVGCSSDSEEKSSSESSSGAETFSATDGESKGTGTGEISRDDASDSRILSDSEISVLSKELESVTDEIVENSSRDEYDRMRAKTISGGCDSLTTDKICGKGHSDRTYHIERMRSSEIPDNYKSGYDKRQMVLSSVEKDTVRKLKDIWKKSRTGGLLKGQYLGQKLQTSSFARNDCKYFAKKILPKSRSLAVAVLVDESGSMNGRKEVVARDMAIVMYNFCKELDIPIAIYGHSADQNGIGSVEMYEYTTFCSNDKNDRYRLMDIRGRRENIDGAANHFVSEVLSQRPEEQKLLIVVSDGCPCGSHYYGKEGFDDIKAVKKAYACKGVTTFAAAIDSDKEQIKDCYGEECFLDITDLNKLPEALISLVRRFMRV